MKSHKIKKQILRLKAKIAAYRLAYKHKIHTLKKQLVDAVKRYNEAMEQERIEAMKKRLKKMKK